MSKSLTYNLSDLSPAEAQAILTALDLLPHRDVRGLIDKAVGQFRTQTDAHQKTGEPAPSPVKAKSKG